MNPHKPIRIVSLAPNVTSILLELGAARELVGVSRWCKDVAPVGRRPTVGDCWKLDVREVMKLEPTIVIGSVPFAPETVAKLLAEPVVFLAINSRTLSGIEQDIRLIGSLANRGSAAEKLVQRMRRGFAAVRKRAHAAEAASRRKAGHLNSSRLKTGHLKALRLKIYCEAWPNPRISSPPWVEELVTLAGGTLVVPSGQRVSDEHVAEADPDVIVLAWAATGARANPGTAFRNHAWKDVSAVRHKRVVVIRDELLNTPGPPLVRGAQELQRVIEKFTRQLRKVQKISDSRLK